MAVLKEKIKYIRYSMVCDNCGDGRMQYIRDSKKNDNGYEHMCDNCGITAIYPIQYPYMREID